MTDASQRLAQLKQAVAESSINYVAKRIGVSRTAISLIVADKYPAKIDKVLQAFEQAYGQIDCPHLQTELSRQQCREFASKARPSNQLGLAHWRACQQCPHRS
ncbi:helix-turn-helix domain-containing protein [Methylomonas sp. MED-D]|uniref:helix-turn-helix domain-containing protein n=1 Tax=unclassified Methylomonas TaxID=2608980 RepID=UPI003D02DE52